MHRGKAAFRRRDRLSAFTMVVCGVLSLAAAAPGDPFVEEKSGAVIDWRRGAIVATAGAAADHRMPSADISRPGAERRARAAARAKIAGALRVLPLGGGRHLDEASVARAVGRARSENVEYQSNGGVLVRMEIAFGDWAAEVAGGAGAGGGPGGGAPKQPDSVPLWLPEGHFAAAPLLVVAGREIALPSARYAATKSLPTDVRPLHVRADKQGRLVVDDGGGSRELLGRPVVIYVQKILR